MSTEDVTTTATEPEAPTFVPNRIFMNLVDSFNARYISAYLTDQIYGLQYHLPDGAEEENDEDDVLATAEDGAPIGPTILGQKYEIIGTLKGEEGRTTEDILYTVENDVRTEVMRCGTIIYDITVDRDEIDKALSTLQIIVDEIKKVEEIGPKTFAQYAENKVFVLISTAMTWGSTKNLHPRDPDFVFTEEDYRKRKCHPDYKPHLDCEREVIRIGRLYPDKLKTYVICAGLIYGEEQYDLEGYFRLAWYNKSLPIHQTGQNYVPLIHINDLARILHGVLALTPLKPQYVLAVEEVPCTQDALIKALSTALGMGDVYNVTSMDELTSEANISDKLAVKITMNLKMEPVYALETLRIRWEYGVGHFVTNIQRIVDVFRQKRRWRPIKLILHGPPGCDKVACGRRLAAHYGLKYISLDGTENCPQEPLLDRTYEVDLFTTHYLQDLLMQNVCQNQGYVLNDYPKTVQQAAALFSEPPLDGGEDLATPPHHDRTQRILPNVVISFHATNTFLYEKIKQLPEEEIDEEQFRQMLNEYRHFNTEEYYVLDYFNEIEIYPIIYQYDTDIEALIERIIEKLGAPEEFVMLSEDLALRRRLDELARAEAEDQRRQAELLQSEYEQHQRNDMESWLITLEKLQMEEEKLLVAQSEPFRNYLMKYVFPTLTKGLVEIVKIKPDDPLDFLAEFLFKTNPEGRMFDPSYTKECDIELFPLKSAGSKSNI